MVRAVREAGVDVRGSVRLKRLRASVVGAMVLDEGGVQIVLFRPLPCSSLSDS